MSKMQQAKGRAFELHILRTLWEGTGSTAPWKPNTRPDDGHPLPPQYARYHLEMKRQERLNFWAAVEQASKEAAKNCDKETWAVIAKRSHRPPIVILDFDDWQDLVIIAMSNRIRRK